MPPRSSTVPSSPKRAAVQAAVLQATEQLLGEGATYADLNIERIATRAGISRTAFYFYFADKRELLMRLTEDVTDELYTQADIWYSGSGDPETEIRQALGNIARLYEQHGPLLRAIVEVSTYDDEVAAFWRRLLGRFVEASRMRIVAEQEAGRSSGCDAARDRLRALLDGRARALPGARPGRSDPARRSRRGARVHLDAHDLCQLDG